MNKFELLKDFEMYFERGNIAHIARSMEDAVSIKTLIRKSWNLDNSEEYFYTDFNSENVIFEKYILPILNGEKISELNCIPLILRDSSNKVICTISMIFDHEKKFVEFGRGASDITSTEHNKLNFLTQFAQNINKQTVGFSTISDCTTLYNTLAHKLITQNIQPVALHPFGFVLQKSALKYWQKMLGDKLYDYLLYKSDLTNMVRFTTTFHLKLESNVQVERAVLTEKQKHLYNFTCKILSINKNQFCDLKTQFVEYEKTSHLLGTKYIGLLYDVNPKILSGKAKEEKLD